MNALEPIHCQRCGAAVPLIDAPEQTCRYCEHAVETPPEYLDAVHARRDIVAARKAAEPKWRRLAAGSSPWWMIAGGALMTLAPPTATAVGFSLEPAQSTALIFALMTLPSLFPGSLVFVWGATSDLTRDGVRAMVAARPSDKEGAPPECRVCGAPLEVSNAELSCTCLYCGTDSLVTDIPVTAISAERRQAFGSLERATRVLRLRLWVVHLALVLFAVFLGGLAVALYAAHRHLQ